ncbi:MAG: nitrogenase [Brasilonema octagenarum HA4186-MV1]|jgi:hypothetical protein|nr:nitrogenase [Brasilonema octagenarum HA4186-MV1]
MTPNKGKMMIPLLQRKLDSIEIRNLRLARFLCRLIPESCPFHRTFKLMGYLINIPSICQINPFYEQLMSLRFRALECLAHY